jgi:uncharacterized repeat protein (TIGR03803 family)
MILAAATASPAQDEQASPNVVKFKTLVNFEETNGEAPFSGLVQGTGGNLYGTAILGGTYNSGSVFKMTPSGALTVLYNFCAMSSCPDGANPSGLTLGTDGNFYSTSVGGGMNGQGTIFKMTPNGALTTLYNFCSQPNCADVILNDSGVVEGADGNFYGTTPYYGANNNSACVVFAGYPGCGTVFKITPAGAFTTIYSFCSLTSCADGGVPYSGLTAGSDGNLYGSTSAGGAFGYGTIFKITRAGELTTLHSFGGTDGNCGYLACAPLIQAANGSFYGTTIHGGTNPGAFSGTAFEITSAGEFRTLYNFCSQANCADGQYPWEIVQGADGNFYGVTGYGGADSCTFGCGTVFKLTPDGVLTTLHSFNGTDGYFPLGFMHSTNGIFYGTTVGGGGTDLICPPWGCGTVFALSVGLGPFVQTLPTGGKAGEGIRILGTDLTGATSVCFDGRPAEFKVVSPTEIVAKVPAGATSGFVTVTTPTGTLKSNVPFYVWP